MGRGVSRLRDGDDRSELLVRQKKTIADAGESLDKARVLGSIANRLPQLLHRRIQAVLEIDKRVGRPQRCAQHIAGHHFSPHLQQHDQDLEGLTLQLDADAVFAQLRRIGENLKIAETIDAWGNGSLFHSTPGLQG